MRRPTSTCIPEFVLPAAERKAFMTDRKGAVVGRKLAEQYGWNVGDVIPLRGTIYSGNWSFTLRGIYDADKGVDQSTMFFHWDYLNESIKKIYPRRGDQTGVFIVQLKDPGQAAEVSAAIDAMFKNSLAETLTETEKAFQLSFVAMTEAILLAIQAVSFVVIVIIMAVMANTMAMTARERGSEYATLKALGFFPRLRRAPHPRRIPRHRARGRRRCHRAHGADRPRVRGSIGHALSDLFRERANDDAPGPCRPRRRAGRRRPSRVAHGVGADRRRAAGMRPKGRPEGEYRSAKREGAPSSGEG
jgi:hypothetical protein